MQGCEGLALPLGWSRGKRCVRRLLPCLACGDVYFSSQEKGGFWYDTSETELLTFASCRLRTATKAMHIPFVRLLR